MAHNILILGGITEAREVATMLVGLGYHVTYSLRYTPLKTLQDVGTVHIGAWQSHAHLQTFLKATSIDLLIDITHPFATKISSIAKQASQNICPLIGFNRPSFTLQGEHIHPFDSINQLWPKISEFSCVLFALGRSIFIHLHKRPAHQSWVIRTFTQPAGQHDPLIHFVPCQNIKNADQFTRFPIQALVCKDSGGAINQQKIEIAQQKWVPIFIQKRPAPQTYLTQNKQAFMAQLKQHLN